MIDEEEKEGLFMAEEVSEDIALPNLQFKNTLGKQNSSLKDAFSKLELQYGNKYDFINGLKDMVRLIEETDISFGGKKAASKPQIAQIPKNELALLMKTSETNVNKYLNDLRFKLFGKIKELGTKNVNEMGDFISELETFGTAQKHEGT